MGASKRNFMDDRFNDGVDDIDYDYFYYHKNDN